MKERYLHNPGALKIDLMLQGIKIDDPVLKAWACGADGMDILLPRDTLVNVPCSDYVASTSPYVIKKAGEGHVITFEGAGEVPVRFLPKPDFYYRKTSTGVPFSRIASVHGSYTAITPSPRCEFFNRNIECKYCAGNFDDPGADDTVFSVDEVLETVRAVIKEKVSEIIYLSVGFTEGDDGGVEFLRPYVRAIKKHFNVLVAVEVLPPKENRWIDATYAMGADSVLYNLEIYDREIFELVCPGRAELIGWKRYAEALRYAAGIFPSGTVASHLIVGLEPPGSTIRGIDFLIAMGVVPILPVIRPSRDRSYHIHPLDAEVIIPVYKHLYKALKGSDVNFRWVRDISIVTTPVEGRLLLGEDGDEDKTTFLDNFYGSRLGLKAAWGLSTIRRKLRVKEVKDPSENS